VTLIESIYNEPESWRLTPYWLIHKSGTMIWISNGWIFCEPGNHTLSLINKFRLWRAFRWWVINAPVERL
jgi:hypothetical protein